jgi:hypothetical protein
MDVSDTDHRAPARWIILVERGQEELYEHLAEAFRRDRKVEVIMDRRKGARRNPARVADHLSSRGVAVIRREP